MRTTRIGGRWAWAGMASGVLSLAAHGQVILRVDRNAPGGGDGSGWGANAIRNLRTAIDNATPLLGNATVQIWVADGTYHPDEYAGFPNGDGDANKSYTLLSKLEIYGGFAGGENLLSQRNPAVNICILSGDLAGNDLPNWLNRSENSVHVVTAAAGVSSTAILDGFTIRAGHADSTGGGGLHASGASPVITNCIFTDNEATSPGPGGAVRITGGTVPLTACTFNANRAPGAPGGALSIEGAANVTLTTCAFSSNTAPSGGALNAASTATLTASACTLAANTATSGVGGAVSAGTGTATLRSCTFTSNSAAGDGGALSGGVGTRALACTFLSNHAGQAGGAVIGAASCVNSHFLGNSADARAGAVRNVPSLAGCFFSGNVAPRGAAAQIASGNASFINCTFAANMSTGTDPALAKGALQYNGVNTLTVSNCIFFRNQFAGAETEDAQIKLDGGGAIVLTRSFVQGLTGSLGGTGNIGGAADADPRFADGPGPDHVFGTLDDSATLFPGSPCIDAADSTLLPPDVLDADGDSNTTEPLPIDAAGNTRRIDDPTLPDTGAGGSPALDMGAFEATSAARRWTAGGTGSFSQNINWYPDTPSGNEVAAFYKPLATTVTFTQNAAFGLLSVASGTVRLNMGAFNVDTTSALPSGRNVLVGADRGQPARLILAPTSGQFITENVQVDRWGSLYGTGLIDCTDLVNGGAISPGDDVADTTGTLTLTGNYSQYIDRSQIIDDNRRGTLQIDVEGVGPGQFDRLMVQGSANLTGTLRILTPPTFDPPPNMNIEILHADGGFSVANPRFDVAYLPGLTDGRFYKIDYAESGGVYLSVLDLGGDVGFGSKGGSVAHTLTAVAAGELNDDALLDIAVATDDGFVILLFNGGNDGGGNWLGFTSSLQLSSGGTSPGGLAIADFDPANDNGNDVAVTNTGSDNIVVLYRNNVGVWNQSTTIALTAGDSPVGLCAVDLDGDGDLDLACANSGSNTVQAPLNNSGAGISFSAGSRTPTDDGPVDVDPWDPDNPKDAASVAVANFSAGTVSFHPNNGDGTFAAFTSYAVGDGPAALASEDFNGDGNEDIVSVDSLSATISVLLNAGGVAFNDAAPVGVGDSPSSIAVADYDQDGDPDIAITAVNESSVRVVQLLQNSITAGDFTVAFVSPVELSTDEPPALLDHGDVDADGYEDIIAVSDSGAESTTNITVRLNLFRTCIADFDRNVFVNGDDFDAFTLVFEAGDPGADLNHDSFVTGDDFDLFMEHFAAGC